MQNTSFRFLRKLRLSRQTMRTTIFLSFALCMLCMIPSLAIAKPRVSFELAAAKRLPPGKTHQWLNVFKSLDQDGIRIRTARPSDRPSVVNRGTEDSPSYHVVGLITSSNQLLLPRGRFSTRDSQDIAKWIQRLRKHGLSGPKPADQATAFGLTAKQLTGIHQKLAAPVAAKTQGLSPKAVARAIVQGLNIRGSVDPAVRNAFKETDKVAEELQGVSSGTALAVVLRPLGLVLVPQKLDDGTIGLRITDANSRHAPLHPPRSSRQTPRNPHPTRPQLTSPSKDRPQQNQDHAPLETNLLQTSPRQVPLQSQAKKRTPPRRSRPPHPLGIATNNAIGSLPLRKMPQKGVRYAYCKRWGFPKEALGDPILTDNSGFRYICLFAGMAKASLYH